MIITKKEYEPAPEGTHDGVCVDAHDLGEVQTPWGPQPKLKLVWEIPVYTKDNKRFTVSKRYTASINEKSTFYKDLKSWFGKGPTKSFDTDALIGKKCKLIVQHDERDDNVYANVMAVLKADPGVDLVPSGDYVRIKDREIRDERKATGTDGVPF